MYGEPAGRHGSNIALFKSRSCVFPPFAHRASVFVRGPAPWTKRGKRATSGALFRSRAAFPGSSCRKQHRPFQSPRKSPPIRIDTVDIYSSRAYAIPCSQYPPVTPAVKRKRRQDPRQTTFAFRPTGRGGARPGAGRRRIRKSRVPHRSRGDIDRDCPLLVTLRVLDGVPALRRACFVRAFRESLRGAAERPGFRVVHYSIQDNHAHFLVEAADRLGLANGMKSLGARFARCVNRVYRRTGRVLATRFHHVVKRTPTEVRNALAYVLLNARKHYRERRGRTPPVVLDGASSGLWFDGWKGRSPPRPGEVRGRAAALRGGRGADVAAGDGLAAGRADRSGGGSGNVGSASGRRRLGFVRHDGTTARRHGARRSCQASSMVSVRNQRRCGRRLGNSGRHSPSRAQAANPRCSLVDESRHVVL